jgi:multiple sugar transport system ATP-binding protein
VGSVVLRNVWKRYGNVEAVKNLNLECKSGEFLALLGPSGCGKTSSLRMVAGLEKASEGDVLIDGKRVNDLEPRSRDIAMAFEAYALYPHLTAYENIAFPLRIRGMKGAEIDRRVKEIAEVLQITEVLGRKPTHLSGGQQQRVSFARALVRPASVYLMDEPLSHLDAKQRSQLRGELKRLHRLRNLTIIFVTHDQIEALAMADRIAVMAGGLLQQVDTPQRVFNEPANLFVADFVGEPSMNFIEGELQASEARIRFVTRQFSVSMPEGARSAAARVYLGKKVVLGVRPLHVTVHLDAHGKGEQDLCPAEVYVTEGLGDFTIITTRIEPDVIRAEAPRDLRPARGQTVYLEFNTSRLHIFDGETGINIFQQT